MNSHSPSSLSLSALSIFHTSYMVSKHSIQNIFSSHYECKNILCTHQLLARLYPEEEEVSDRSEFLVEGWIHKSQYIFNRYSHNELNQPPFKDIVSLFCLWSYRSTISPIKNNMLGTKKDISTEIIKATAEALERYPTIKR